MGLVDNWLNGIGLGYAVPAFAGQGINSPDMLSELEVVDFPELGISDKNDRKKLFYLIQRVRLALDRGRAGDKDQAAPQADSEVSSSSTAAAMARKTGTASDVEAAKESKAEEKEEDSSVKFRRKPEVPAARNTMVAAPRAAEPRSSPSSSGGSGGASGGVGGGPQTPAKVQRLPPSHRRPKTPHTDGTALNRRPASFKASSPKHATGDRLAAAEGSWSVKAPSPKHATGDRLAAAEGSWSSGAAVALASDKKPTAVRTYPQQARQGSSSQAAHGVAQAPEHDERLRRDGKVNKPLEQHRIVLEPVQLDEAGGRARFSSSPRHRLYPPPSPRHPTQQARPMTPGTPSFATAGFSRSRTAWGEAERVDKKSENGRTARTKTSIPASPRYKEKQQAAGRQESHFFHHDDEKDGRTARTKTSIPASPRYKEKQQAAGRQETHFFHREDEKAVPPVRKVSATATAAAAAAAKAGNSSTRSYHLPAQKPKPRVTTSHRRSKSSSTVAIAATAAASPWNETREVARLNPVKRSTASTAGAVIVENNTAARRSHEVERTPQAGIGSTNSGGQVAPSRRRSSDKTVPGAVAGEAAAEKSLSERQPQEEEEAEEEGEEEEEEKQEDAETQSEAAAESAMHLISAHKEDVRSALAAARRDMDLVSKADQDRRPAALLDYAREVEEVLSVRLAAGAKLRAVLDSYVAMRKAQSRRPVNQTELRERKLRSGRRAVQA